MPALVTPCCPDRRLRPPWFDSKVETRKNDPSAAGKPSRQLSSPSTRVRTKSTPRPRSSGSNSSSSSTSLDTTNTETKCTIRGPKRLPSPPRDINPSKSTPQIPPLGKSRFRWSETKTAAEVDWEAPFVRPWEAAAAEAAAATRMSPRPAWKFTTDFATWTETTIPTIRKKTTSASRWTCRRCTRRFRLSSTRCPPSCWPSTPYRFPTPTTTTQEFRPTNPISRSESSTRAEQPSKPESSPTCPFTNPGASKRKKRNNGSAAVNNSSVAEQHPCLQRPPLRRTIRSCWWTAPSRPPVPGAFTTHSRINHRNLTCLPSVPEESTTPEQRPCRVLVAIATSLWKPERAA
mmetsp:Transcript_3150/g.8698  ORF Transcript_3150/g.8698 Transcript_3150/m.8698 type:complete len:347 (+) Transcript_3150:1338-2378(+)